MQADKRYLVLAFVCFLAGGLRASPLYWDGNGSAPGFSGSGQWDSGATPNWNSAEDFSGTWGLWNQTVGQDIAVFTNSAGVVTVSGGVNAKGFQFGVDGYVVTNGTITLTAGAVLNVVTASTATIHSVLAGTSGSLNLEKTGEGTLILTGASTFNRPLTIRTGVVSARANAALGTATATTVEDGAALEVQGNISSGETLTLRGTGIVGTGALRSRGGDNTVSGGITVDQDVRINNDSGTLRLTGQITLNNASLTVGGDGTNRIQRSGSGTRPIVGNGGLVKDGPGLLILSAASDACTYTGATHVANGTLQLGDTGIVNPDKMPTGTRLILGEGGTSGVFDMWAQQTIGGIEIRGTGTANLITNSTATARTLTINTPSADIFSGPIAGPLALSLTWNNAGSLTLKGANGYSGATTLGNGSQLTLDYTANNSSKLGAGATTLQGAALTIAGSTAASTAQNLNNLTVNTGHSTITVTPGSGQTATLNLGSIARTAPGTVEFAPTANGTITTTSTLTGGLIGGGGWATFGTDWATKSGSDIVALTTYDPFLTSGTTSLNELLTGSATLTGTKTLRSLKIDTDGTGQSLDLDAYNLVMNASRALLFVGADDYTITGSGSLGGSGNEMLVHARGDGVLTLGSPISGGAGTFIKNGAGTVILTANNAYTGATSINQGVLRMGVANAISATTPVTVNAGGTWDLNGQSQAVGAIAGLGTISVGTASLTASSASSTTYSGQIQGQSSGTFIKDGTGTLTFGGQIDNTFAGTTYVSGGVLTLARPGYTNVAGNLTIGDGTGTDQVNLNTSHQIADTSRITINSSGYLALANTGSLREHVGDVVIVGGADEAFRNLDVSTTSQLIIGSLDMTGGRIGLGRSTGADGILRLQGNVIARASSVPAYLAMSGIGTWNVGNCGRVDLNGEDRVFHVEDGAAAPDMKIGVRIVNDAAGTTAGWIKDGPGTVEFVREWGLDNNGNPALQGAPLASYNGPTVFRDGRVTLVIANNLPQASSLTLGHASGSSGVLELNGCNQRVSPLFSEGAGSGNRVVNSAATSALLEINAAVDVYGVYAGSFADNPSGPLTLSKLGVGRQDLLGASTHSGGTAIGSGALAINADAALGAVPASPTPATLNVNGGTLAAVSNAVVSLHVNRQIGIGATSGTGAATGRLGAFGNGVLRVNGVVTTAGTSGATSLAKDGDGLVDLMSDSTYTGTTTVNAGALRLSSAGALPGGIGVSGGTSALTLSGGVLELAHGDFERPRGTGVGQVQFLAPGGGFSAFGADRYANLGGATGSVTWASGNFVPANSALILNSAFADRMIDFQNPIALATTVREIRADDNPALSTDWARISGALTGTGASGLNKTGAGILELTAANTYAGVTTVSAGTLLINGSLSASASTVNVNGGALGGTGTIHRSVNVAAGAALAPGGLGAVGTLTISGNVTLAEGAVFNLNVVGGVAGRVAVGQTLYLPANATLNVTGAADDLPSGTVLFTAADLDGATGSLSGWTVSGVDSRHSVVVVGTSVVVRPPPGGTVVFFR